MKFAIVPVKDPSRAKERLSSILPQDVRTALAYAMLEDVLTALAGSGLLDRKFIVSLDTTAIKIAEDLGIEVIHETEQKGESASVDFASRICKEMGAQSVLVIPGDAPLITTEDIDFILERESDAPSAILVPARDYLGTNAILRKPPDAFPSLFGHDSFRKHLDEAAGRNIKIDTFENPRIALDIDNPDDLREFASIKSDTKTYELLSGMNLLNKVAG
ncbi:MAG: 2-phospho-L-lactate guanylyltransferase [Deltaproteobacteria bacterium]